MDSFSPNITQNQGWLEIICGCMFSGKTEELIKLTKRAQFAHKKIQIFKPIIDDRYRINFVVSHSNFKFPCEVIEDSSDIKKLLKPNTEFIAIDEVQFLDQGIVDVVSELASSGKQVICSGLDTDWQGRPFHPMPLLLATADIIRKQYAVCAECGAPATRSQRTVPSNKNILVGSGEVYQARCRMHFKPFEYTINENKQAEVTL